MCFYKSRLKWQNTDAERLPGSGAVTSVSTVHDIILRGFGDRNQNILLF